MSDTSALTAEERAANAISALFIAQPETRDWLIASIASAIREAEQANRIKAECYDACESVARNRLAHISPDLEAEIPRLCEIEQRIWEQHRDHMPINAVDMLEHAKRKRLEERIAALESALEPFSDVDGEGSEDFGDETPVVATFGRTTHYSLRLGHFRAARRVMNEGEA